MDWLRLWHDMPNDPKWGTIARKCGEPISLVMATYIHLLVDASRNVTRGHVTVTVEDLATALNVTDEQITNVLAAMEGRVIEDGLLLGWSKRQPKREDSGNPETGAKSAAQRQAEARERKRMAKLEAESNLPVTPSHDESHKVTTEEIREEEIREDKKKTGDKERASPTGSRLPADWILPDDWAEWAKQNRPDLATSETAMRFADYWHSVAGAKGRKADWQATWRNWVRNEKAAAAKPAQAESFKERDDRKGRERWEQMTGRIHPDNIKKPPPNVIDVTPFVSANKPAYLEITA